MGIAAIKYSDLSNQIFKDYIFDVDRFTASEGNTGPYIIYTVVRINSILKKFTEVNPGYRAETTSLQLPSSENERNLMIKITHFNDVIQKASWIIRPIRFASLFLSWQMNLTGFIMKLKLLLRKTS